MTCTLSFQYLCRGYDYDSHIQEVVDWLVPYDGLLLSYEVSNLGGVVQHHIPRLVVQFDSCNQAREAFRKYVQARGVSFDEAYFQAVVVFGYEEPFEPTIGPDLHEAALVVLALAEKYINQPALRGTRLGQSQFEACEIFRAALNEGRFRE
jgi:hypothetical protein